MQRTRIFAAIVGAAMLFAACTPNTNVGTRPTTTTSLPPVVVAGYAYALQAFDQCDAFLDYVKEHALELVTPWGLPGTGWYGPVFAFAEEAARDTAAAAAPAPGVDYSGTNVQVAGIDEPDLVKTDGLRLVAVADGRLHVVDLTGDEPRLLGSMTLNGLWTEQMLLHGDTVLLLGAGDGPNYDSGDAAREFAPVPYNPTAALQTVDISDPENPRITATLWVDGGIVAARQFGSIARIVIRSAPVGLEFTSPGGSGLRAEREALEENRRIIRESTFENWVPYSVLERNGSTTEGVLLDCKRTYHPGEFAGLDMLSVFSVDLDETLQAADPVGVLSGGDTVYASHDRLYVATSPWMNWPVILERLEAGEEDDEAIADALITHIHAFALGGGTGVTYVGSGEVEGYLLNQFAMDEHEGYLRVASTSAPESFGWWRPVTDTSESRITVLRLDDDRLTPVSVVDGMGKGERIYSVRFMGPVAYVVTFRQVDPLYAVDLTDPQEPVLRGELKILGYSAYLHPIDDDGRLIGVGQDADDRGRTEGTQIAVFDVADLDDPNRIDKLTIDNAGSEAEWDHHAFLYWADTRLLVLPLQRWGDWDDEGDYYDNFFAGALAVRIEADGTVTKLGEISHQPAVSEGRPVTDEEIWKYSPPIRRALVVGDRLLTVSHAGVLFSDLGSLEPVTFVSFDG